MVAAMNRNTSTLCILLILLCMVLANQAQLTLAPFVYANSVAGRPGSGNGSGSDDVTKDGEKGGHKAQASTASSIPVTVTVVDFTTDDGTILPNFFYLDQNFPNPFNAATVIKYGVSEERRVVIAVFNILGQRVSTLVDDVRSPGRYEVTWDPGDLASGVYFCRMVAGRFHRTRQMIQLK
jgi:hypothetical protein